MVEIGRYDFLPVSKTLSPTGVQIFPGRPGRVALLISAAAAPDVTISWGSANAANVVVRFASTQPYVILLYSQIGDLLFQPWFGVSPASQTVTATEVWEL